MNDNYPTKSYKLLYLWFIIYITIMAFGAYLTGVCFVLSNAVSMRIMFILCFTLLVLLMYIIYKSERVYFINGVSYEEARKASSSIRKQYALKHLKNILYAFVIYIVFSAVSFYFSLKIFWDVLVFFATTVGFAFSTLKIKL